MPRKGPAPRREVLPDPKYHDTTVSKFVNMMMQNGAKGVAEKNSVRRDGAERKHVAAKRLWRSSRRLWKM